MAEQKKPDSQFDSVSMAVLFLAVAGAVFTQLHIFENWETKIYAIISGVVLAGVGIWILYSKYRDSFIWGALLEGVKFFWQVVVWIAKGIVALITAIASAVMPQEAASHGQAAPAGGADGGGNVFQRIVERIRTMLGGTPAPTQTYQPPGAPLDLLPSLPAGEVKGKEERSGKAVAGMVVNAFRRAKLAPFPDAENKNPPAPQVIGYRSGPSAAKVTVKIPDSLRLTFGQIQAASKNLRSEMKTKSLEVEDGDKVGEINLIVAHDKKYPVGLRETLASKEWSEFAAKATLPVILGSNVIGEPEFFDLGKAPHLLIAGGTGSGKSVYLNCLTSSLTMAKSPAELKIVGVDPKAVELEAYKYLPHTLEITDQTERGEKILAWACTEMDRRYQDFKQIGVKDIKNFNSQTKGEKMPWIVIIIEEFADLVETASEKDAIFSPVQRLAQKARAAGIHLVAVTQRPSKEVIPGVIKANLPTRICFKLKNPETNYPIVLDSPPRTDLTGNGDGLAELVDGTQIRFQAPIIAFEDAKTEKAIKEIGDWWREQGHSQGYEHYDIEQFVAEQAHQIQEEKQQKHQQKIQQVTQTLQSETNEPDSAEKTYQDIKEIIQTIPIGEPVPSMEKIRTMLKAAKPNVLAAYQRLTNEQEIVKKGKGYVRSEPMIFEEDDDFEYPNDD